MSALRILSPSRSPADRTARAGVSWTLHAYLGIEILKVFGFVLLMLELGYALLVSVVISRRLDIDFLLVLPAFWTTALAMLNDSIPLALLFATALVYGRAVADREMTALKSFGLSHRQLLAPALLLGLAAATAGSIVVGYLAPEMNFRKRDIGRALLEAQLRYLGEGSNRDFPFGNHSLWIRQYNGRSLQGIFLSLQLGSENNQKDGGGQGILPEELVKGLNPVSESLYLYAQRGEVLLPEDLRREGFTPPRRPRDGTAGADEEAEGESELPTVIVFRLYNVRLFVSDQIFHPHEPSDFMQRMDLDVLPVSYDPAGSISIRRRPKQLSLGTLASQMPMARRELEAMSPEDPAYAKSQEEYFKTVAEFHWRWARMASFFLYPVLAAVVALFLNAENRFVAFFVSCIIGPSAFYGLGTVGQILGEKGFAPWLSLHMGTILLVGIPTFGFYVLERGQLQGRFRGFLEALRASLYRLPRKSVGEEVESAGPREREP
ncbi:MAG: LptF/LptG family permease [Planctomycetes bacterium]|nr:LptF/LptG family permease [Planctomycetota bacterium]